MCGQRKDHAKTQQEGTIYKTTKEASKSLNSEVRVWIFVLYAISHVTLDKLLCFSFLICKIWIIIVLFEKFIVRIKLINIYKSHRTCLTHSKCYLSAG